MYRTYFLSFALLFVLQGSFGQNSNKPICFGEKITVKSEVLNQDRDIQIRLPDDYDTSNEEYTVHYVLDGEITFTCYSSIVQLKYFSRKIPKAIVVGIPNVNRSFDMNPKENATNFLKFITHELIPEIDTKYRTNTKRILTGYSMAGNFVINALLHQSNYFDMFLSGSPYRHDIYK